MIYFSIACTDGDGCNGHYPREYCSLTDGTCISLGKLKISHNSYFKHDVFVLRPPYLTLIIALKDVLVQTTLINASPNFAYFEFLI